MAVLYRHIRLDTNQPFYIGIGKTEKRAYSIHSRNKHWKSIVNKAGYKTDIMFNNLTWEEACSYEKYLIAWYGRKDITDWGTLVNMTDGGEGITNPSAEHRAKMSEARKNISDETKQKMSEAKLNNKNCVGRVLSVETKAKMSEWHKGKVISAETRQKMSNSRRGKPRSAETRAKISEARKLYWKQKAN